jgi:cell division protein FtsW
VKTKKTPADHILVASIFLLLGVGLVTLYSGSYSAAELSRNDGLFFIKPQLLYCGIGLVLFFMAAFVIPLDWLRNKTLVVMSFLAVFIPCVLTIIPTIGVELNGASRWLILGNKTVQPSEFVKLVLPFYLAHMLDQKQDSLDFFQKSVLPLFIITFLFIAVIALQNNFSTAVFVAVNMTLVFIMAGIRIRYILGAWVVLGFLGFFFVLLEPHRLDRLYHFFAPGNDPQGIEFQANHSMIAVTSGGFWGKGLGQGTLKISSVPEIHSDFIFSAFAEEFGFLGVLLFFSLFILFMIRGYQTAFRSSDMYRRLLAFSYVTLITSQTACNIAVVVGLLPTTGLPLPFFSAGGSSLIITLTMCGVLVNISKSFQPLDVWYTDEHTALP